MKSHINRYRGNRLAVCNTVVLPQNLLTTQGMLWEDFENVADWTALNGSRAANTAQFKTGTQSLKITSPAGSTGNSRKTVSWDLSAPFKLSFWFYVHDAIANYASLGIYLGNDSSNRFWYQFPTAYENFKSGWNLAYVTQDMFTVQTGAPSWGSLITQLLVKCTGNASNVVNASFDNLVFGYVGLPAILLSFDDGYTSAYTEGFGYMKPRNIPGTLYYIHVALTNKITIPQLQEMYANRWAIANHTYDHLDMTTLSEPDQETQIQNEIDDLVANSMPGFTKHLAYPGGKHDANTLIAMVAKSMLTGRTGYNNPSFLECLPPENLYLVFGKPVNNTNTLATVKGWVDTAIAQKGILTLVFHKLVASPSVVTEWVIADYQVLCDYIYAKWKVGLIYPITIDDLYNLTLGPVRVPVVR